MIKFRNGFTLNGDGKLDLWPHKPVLNASYRTSMRPWIADINKDGEIVSKVWNADGPNYHVDYWRNDINNP